MTTVVPMEGDGKRKRRDLRARRDRAIALLAPTKQKKESILKDVDGLDNIDQFFASDTENADKSSTMLSDLLFDSVSVSSRHSSVGGEFHWDSDTNTKLKDITNRSRAPSPRSSMGSVKQTPRLRTPKHLPPLPIPSPTSFSARSSVTSDFFPTPMNSPPPIRPLLDNEELLKHLDNDSLQDIPAFDVNQPKESTAKLHPRKLSIVLNAIAPLPNPAEPTPTPTPKATPTPTPIATPKSIPTATPKATPKEIAHATSLEETPVTISKHVAAKSATKLPSPQPIQNDPFLYSEDESNTERMFHDNQHKSLLDQTIHNEFKNDASFNTAEFLNDSSYYGSKTRIDAPRSGKKLTYVKKTKTKKIRPVPMPITSKVASVVPSSHTVDTSRSIAKPIPVSNNTKPRKISVAQGFATTPLHVKPTTLAPALLDDEELAYDFTLASPAARFRPVSKQTRRDHHDDEEEEDEEKENRTRAYRTTQKKTKPTARKPKEPTPAAKPKKTKEPAPKKSATKKTKEVVPKKSKSTKKKTSKPVKKKAVKRRPDGTPVSERESILSEESINEIDYSSDDVAMEDVFSDDELDADENNNISFGDDFVLRDLDAMKYDQVKLALAHYELPTAGRKAEMIARLKQHLADKKRGRPRQNSMYLIEQMTTPAKKQQARSELVDDSDDAAQPEQQITGKRITRTKPLEFWKNERVEYARKQRKSGDFATVVSLIRSEEQGSSIVPPSKRRKYNEEPFPSATIFSVTKQKQIKYRAAKNPSMLKWHAVGEEEDEYSSKLTFKSTEPESASAAVHQSVAYDVTAFASGQLEIAPKSHTTLQNSKQSHEFYYVIAGTAEVCIGTESEPFTLKRGCHFYVPPMNQFFVKNPNASTFLSLLFFRAQDRDEDQYDEE